MRTPPPGVLPSPRGRQGAGTDALPRRLLLGGAAVLGGTAALGGCSLLPQPAYVARTVWPLVARRPETSPPRAGGKILVVRALAPAPGLDQLGVQWLLPDGSLHVDFYNRWAVSPAEGVTDDLRRWLADSGLFAAVVGSDSGLPGDYVLGGELTSFLGEPSRGVARVALALVLIAARAAPAKVLMQRTLVAETPLTATTPAGVVAALLAGLGQVLGAAEAATRRLTRA